MSTYNGWENRQTWNVALWIGNDEGLYNLARECTSYGEFVDTMKDLGGGSQTPDGVAWDDSRLDTEALDRMIQELSGEGEPCST